MVKVKLKMSNDSFGVKGTDVVKPGQPELNEACLLEETQNNRTPVINKVFM